MILECILMAKQTNSYIYKSNKNKSLHPSQQLSHTSELKLLHTLLDITKGAVCEAGTLMFSLHCVAVYGIVLFNSITRF